MAAMLRSSAIGAVNKGPPSSFYSSVDKPNPVLQALDQEINLYVAFMKKRFQPGYKKTGEEACSRAADTLFELWNKYESRLPRLYFQQCLLQMADFLVSIKEYNLALWQCYGRYLKHFGDINVEEITEVEDFRKTFFPTGFEGENADFTFRALMGKSICTYEVVRQVDAKLQNPENVDKCLQLLGFLRLITQVILPREALCWLVYNGTIHMYSIARHLMSLGHSEAVLEYVLWACMCMESSVPLLGVRYLTWRATLYTAVCQCYYDCKAGNHAESFARRALTKINDLSQLEAMSNSPEKPQTEHAFRQATVKMAIMVFKRTAFETRRKPKGILRPKTRANLKDASQLPWPRTQSEKLLSDMFEGSAAQLLCLIETLNDTNRRTLLTAPPAPDSDVEMLDVYAELFMAAQEIIAGLRGRRPSVHGMGSARPHSQTADSHHLEAKSKRAGHGRQPPTTVAAQDHLPREPRTLPEDETRGDISTSTKSSMRSLSESGGGGTQGSGRGPRSSDVKVPGMAGVVPEVALIDLATKGEDGVPLSVVVRMVKLAYNYEQWDTFDTLLDNTLAAIREVNDPQYGPASKDLEILRAYDRVTPRTRQRKLFASDEEVEQNPDAATLPPPASQAGKSGHGMDDLTTLADTLLSIISGPYKQEELDIDMIVDATLCVWNKCKVVFQRYQTGAMDNPRYLQRMENPGKWVYILDVVHQVLGWCGLSTVDPAITAEVVLRLALVLDASASLDVGHEGKSHKSAKSTKFDFSIVEDEGSVTSGVTKDIRQRRESMNTVGTELTHEPSVGMASRISAFSHAVLNATPRDQLLQARDILEQGLEQVSTARQTTIRMDGKTIADISWVKELNEGLFAPLPAEPEVVDDPPAEVATESVAIEGGGEGCGHDSSTANTIKDLHVELLFMYHRICLRLAAIGPACKRCAKEQAERLSKSLKGDFIYEPAVKTKPFKRRNCSHVQYGSSPSSASNLTYIENFEELLASCRRNSLSRALLCLQKALMAGTGSTPTKEQKTMIEEAKGLILKAQTEEKRLYTENTHEPDTDPLVIVTPSRVPPPPLLLARSDTAMTFRPAPFVPASGEKVAWYRIFCRVASGSNIKVRLNDYYVEGAGDEVPSFRCILQTSGLVPGEKYVFAVAAYTAEGKLIGGSIGETSKPILASHPLPVLLTWAYLAQVSYQVGQPAIAAEACEVLWNHFVATPPPPETVTYITSAMSDYRLTLHRLNPRVIVLTSPILLHMFLASIFVNVDIAVQNGALFCNVLCDQGPLSKGQLQRLGQCERLLVALEVAGWLNEANLALQAVVQSYGLLSPMIYFKIPAIPVVQVLERCHAIMQEIPAYVRQRRPAAVAESLHHMTACLTYHLAKVLRTWSQRALAANINDTGRKLLAMDAEGKDRDTLGNKAATHAISNAIAEDGDESMNEANTETGSLTLAALKKKKMRKGAMAPGKDEVETTGNEELKALEAHMLRLSRQGQGEHELSGNEDPSILHAYIAYLPSRTAYKEVAKFKRRARYLEFFVQVAQKALAEGLSEAALDWCDDTIQWLTKRNEQIIGGRTVVNKQHGAYTVIGDDPKKFAAAMVEYGKEKHMRSGDGKVSKATASNIGGPGKGLKAKKTKYKALRVDDTMTEAQKVAQEEAELKALNTLALYLVDLLHMSHKRKRLRKICDDEAPWRAQLNIVQGLSQFGALLHKLEFREKVIGNASNFTHRTACLDQEWFTLETVGTLVVGWEGGPTRLVTRQDHNRSAAPSAGKRGDKPGRATGIEIAAAAATGKANVALFSSTVEEEDTPRTLGGRQGKQARHHGNKAIQEEPETDSVLLTTAETADMLTKTFAFFKKAIVLAHRYQHWTLLQNACRSLWNCTHTALLRTYSPDGESLLTIEMLRGLAWQPFHTATDCLLDMLVVIQQHDKKDKPTKRRQQEDAAFPEPPTSWVGSVHEEKGGASVKFEPLMDDLSTVDLRWVRRIVLRMVEMLYYEHKWERLVDVALRFNALTDNRYAEQVNPLLVQAQHKLISRVEESGGRRPPQPHFVAAKAELGKHITAQKYVGLQLKVQLDPAELTKIEPGAHIDPAGHDVYNNELAYRLCSVPLDVKNSLQTLRTALDNSQYTSRALQHSRRLLTLYLAGQQNEGSTSGGVSRVDFVPTTARPQPTMPVDLRKEDFRSADDVQTAPLPRSQISVVIASYDKTIEMLLASNQKGLAAQAMRELGNVHYHMGNMKGAYKWWSDSLDTLLGTTDAIHRWRHTYKKKSDVSVQLLDQCGLWGCLLGGVLASNLAQYILTSDLGLRTECCFLSGYFFKAIFRSSLPHPTADRDYALYEVGEGCEVTNLVPGVDLLSERFRCDGRTLVATLRFVMDELARGKHNMFVLPLLTLHQYLTTFVCRDLQRAVAGRILRVSVLTEARLFGEAFTTLQRLLHGERLPHTADSHFRQMESRWNNVRFDASRPILDPTNLKVIESVLDKRLSSNLGNLYGPHLTCHLSVVQAHLMITLAEILPVLPKFDEAIGPIKLKRWQWIQKTGKRYPIPAPGSQVYVPPQTISTISRTGVKGGSAAASSRQSETATHGYKHARLDDSTYRGYVDADTTLTPAGKQMSTNKSVTLEEVKGTLLAVADQILSTMSEIIVENAQHEKGVEAMCAAELELVILARLEQAAIAQQRHHAALAARIVLSALTLLQDADIFKERKGHVTHRRMSAFRSESGGSSRESPIKLVEPDSQFLYQNFQSRSRLDARLWVYCRKVLVNSMLLEIRGMGAVKGIDRKVKVELADVRQYCAEGVAESEACGDVESYAEFLLMGVLLDMQDGTHVDNSKLLLKEVLTLLGKVRQLSMSGQLLRVVAMTALADLDAAVPSVSKDGKLITETTLARYCDAQSLLLNELQLLGEKIEHHYPEGEKVELSTPVSPLENLYLPHLLPLVQLKLRIGHAMARNTARTVRDSDVGDQAKMWLRSLGVLKTARELSKVMSNRIASLEAEVLLNIGKVERQLYQLGSYNPRSAANTLLEAIRISYSNNHDLGLIRQAYLEVALLYLASSDSINPRDRVPDRSTMAGSTTDILDDDTVSVSKESSKSKRKKKVEEAVETESKREQVKQRSAVSRGPGTDPADGERDMERRAAAVAVRCATAAGQAMRSRLLLAGNPAVTTQTVTTMAQSALPEFAVLDLVSSYVLGETRRVYKNEIEEELAPLTESLDPPAVETYEDQLNKARTATQGLGWVQLLGYQGILQRLTSTQTLTSTKDADAQPDPEAGDLGPEFDLGFISHAQFDTSVNHDVVRSVIFSSPWSMRLNYLHHFLTEHLPIYASDCSAIYPPEELCLPVTRDEDMAGDVIYTSYGVNKSVTTATGENAPEVVVWEVPSLPAGSQQNPFKPPDKAVCCPADGELYIQWYQPSLEEFEAGGGSVTGQRQVLALYSVIRKVGDRNHANITWVSLPQLLDLHDRLAVLIQRGEISLVDSKPKREPTAESKTTKGKKQTRIKALSPKVKKDEHLEALLKQCLRDTQSLFGVSPDDMSVAPPGEDDEGVERADGKSQTAQSQSTQLLSVPTPLPSQSEIPFDVTKVNVQNFEKLFDPSFGGNLRETKMLKWFFALFQ